MEYNLDSLAQELEGKINDEESDTNVYENMIEVVKSLVDSKELNVNEANLINSVLTKISEDEESHKNLLEAVYNVVINSLE